MTEKELEDKKLKLGIKVNKLTDLINNEFPGEIMDEVWDIVHKYKNSEFKRIKEEYKEEKYKMLEYTFTIKGEIYEYSIKYNLNGNEAELWHYEKLIYKCSYLKDCKKWLLKEIKSVLLYGKDNE